VTITFEATASPMPHIAKPTAAPNQALSVPNNGTKNQHAWGSYEGRDEHAREADSGSGFPCWTGGRGTVLSDLGARVGYIAIENGEEMN